MKKTGQNHSVVAVSTCSTAALWIKQILPLLIVYVCCHVVNFNCRVSASSDTSKDDDFSYTLIEGVNEFFDMSKSSGCALSGFQSCIFFYPEVLKSGWYD